MHTGTMNRRQLVDAAQVRLDRAYGDKSAVVTKKIRLEAELEEVVAREKACDVEIDDANRALKEAARAPENAGATPVPAPTPAAAAVRDFVAERSVADEGAGLVAAINEVN